MERKYFCDDHGIKAQIAAIGDGRFCLTVYGSFGNGLIEQSIFDSYKGARISLGKGSNGGMMEITEGEFLDLFCTPLRNSIAGADEDCRCVLHEITEPKTHTFGAVFCGKAYRLEIVEEIETWANGESGLVYTAWLSRDGYGVKTLVEGVVAADWDNDVNSYAEAIASTLGKDIAEYNAEMARIEENEARMVCAGM